MLVIRNVRSSHTHILLHEQAISKHFLVDYGKRLLRFYWHLISQIRIKRDMSVIIGM